MPSRSPSRPTSDEERQSGHALPCYGADNQPAFAAALSTDVASGLSRFLGPVFTQLGSGTDNGCRPQSCLKADISPTPAAGCSSSISKVIGEVDNLH